MLKLPSGLERADRAGSDGKRRRKNTPRALRSLQAILATKTNEWRPGYQSQVSQVSNLRLLVTPFGQGFT